MAHVVTGRRAFLQAGLGAAVFAHGLSDGVYIAGPVGRRAQLTIEACRAGKDVWVEAPVCTSMEEGLAMIEAARRYRRVVQAATVRRSAAEWQRAREVVRRGELGEISFCRMVGADRAHLVDAVQFVLGDAVPLSVEAQGSGPDAMRLATFHYPTLIASWENIPAAAEAVTFHGAHATLTVGPSDGRLAHWRNFVDCVRTRRVPVSDIESCVRSTAACLDAELALRSLSKLEVSS
jgi:predicted dehydrogenase